MVLDVMVSLHDMNSASLVRSKLVLQSISRRLKLDRIDKLPAPELLHSTETLECEPALFDPEQLSRVRACGFISTLEKEVEKLSSTQFTETPLERYKLGPTLIAGGYIHAGSGTHFFSARSPLKVVGKTLQEMGEVHLASSQQGLKYFGHWLRDDCSVFELLQQNDHRPYAIRRPDWPDAALYETAFSQDWQSLDFAHVEDLILYRELGFNLDKARRIRRLRAKLRAAYPGYTGGQIVYISRGNAGVMRNMSNAPEFETALAAAGIQIATPESDPEALVPALLNARIIITIEGSQAAHGVHMLSDGGAMLILQPPDRFYNPHHEWARLLGMRYGTVIGTPDAASFHMDSNEVLHMVDRLEKVLA